MANENGDVEIGVNIPPVQGADNIKKVNADLDATAKSAEKAGDAITELIQQIGKMRQAGQDSTDYLRKVLEGSVAASAEYRRAAADLVPNFAPELQKLAAEYTKTAQRAAEAGKSEESRAANNLRLIREEITLRKQLNSLASDVLKFQGPRPTFDTALRGATDENSRKAAQRQTKDTLAYNQQVYRDRQQQEKQSSDFILNEVKSREARRQQIEKESARDSAKFRVEQEKQQTKDHLTDERRSRSLNAAVLYPALGNRGGVLNYGLSAASQSLGGRGGYGLQGAASFFENFGTAGLGAAVFVSTAALVTKSLYDIVKSEGEAERNLKNFADTLGLSIPQARQLSIAANLLGLDIHALESAGRTLSAVLEGDAGASKASAEGLARLGINARDAQGGVREFGPVLVEVLERLAKIPDMTTRIRTANETLGRGVAKSLEPMLTSYESTMAAAKKFADQIGDAAGILAADAAIRQYDQSLEVLKKHLGAWAAPKVSGLLGGVNDLFFGDESPEVSKFKFASSFNQGNSNSFDMTMQTLIHGLEPKLAAPNPVGNPEYRDPAWIAEGVSYQNRHRATEEEIRAQLNKLKNDNGGENHDLDKQGLTQLDTLLGSAIDPATRAKALGYKSQKESQVAGYEQQLRDLEKSKRYPEEVANALNRMKATADAAEASLIDSSASAVSRMKDEITVLHLKGEALQRALGYVRQLQAVEDQRDARELTKDRIRNTTSLQQTQFRLSSEAAAHAEKLGYPDGSETTGTINSDLQRQYALSANNRQSTIGSIKRLGPLYGSSTDQQRGINDAIAKEASDNLEAFYRASGLIADLTAKQAKDAKDAEVTLSTGRAKQDRDVTRSQGDQDIKTSTELFRLQGQKSGGLGGSDIKSDLDFRLQVSQKIYEADVRDGEENLANAANKNDAAKALLEIEEARMKRNERDREDGLDYYVKVIELQQRVKSEQQQQTAEIAGGLFDAATSGHGVQGLQQYFLGQGRSIGKTITENFSKVIAPSGLGLSSLFPGQSQVGKDGTTQLTTFGKLLQGTPFGKSKDQIALEATQKSGTDHITVTKDLNTTMRSLDAHVAAWLNGRGEGTSASGTTGGSTGGWAGGGAPGGSAFGGSISAGATPGSFSSPGFWSASGSPASGGEYGSSGGGAMPSFWSGVGSVGGAGGGSDYSSPGFWQATGGSSSSPAGGSGGPLDYNSPSFWTASGSPAGSSSVASAATSGLSSYIGPIAAIAGAGVGIGFTVANQSHFSDTRFTGDSGNESKGQHDSQSIFSPTSLASVVPYIGTGLGIATALGKTLGSGSSLGQFTSGVGSVNSGQALNILTTGGTFSPSAGGGSDDWTQASMGQTVGAAVGLVANTATSALGAIQSFSKGGAKNDVMGAADIAQGIAPFTGPAAPFVEAGAQMLKLVDALVTDPKVTRQNDINNTTREDQYMANPSLNRSLNTAGDETMTDWRGVSRNTSFSSVSIAHPFEYQNPTNGQWEVQQGSVVEPYSQAPTLPYSIAKYQGYSQATNSFAPTTLPAGSTPFGATNGAPIVNLTVHALDSQSVLGRSNDIANALFKELRNGHPVGQQITNTVLGSN